ncbi:hypothetical protein C0995_005303 [Termitomyces sp. Mi166|nr:hypothetical protein C0995_005303 [Termitomyces sp. Mi166\
MYGLVPACLTFLLSLPGRSLAQVNVTVPITASQIDYTPFLCRNSSTDSPEECEDVWQVINSNGTTLVSTHGPAHGSIIPQMFVQFRASGFSLSTSAFSNATTNITVSNNDTVVAATFNSSVGIVSVLNLQEVELSTVVITFVTDGLPTRLDISSITLTVTGNPYATSVFLPSITLPPTATLPIFETPPPPSSPTPVEASSDNHTFVAEAVGITLGLSLGLTVVAVLGYLFWRRRRRRRPPEDSDSEVLPQPSRFLSTSQSQTTTMMAGSGWASHAFGPQVQKQNRK